MSASELPAAPQPARQHLRLFAVSPDGAHLVLVDSEGQEFTVEIDPRLRAALSEGPGRRLETQMDSQVRDQRESQMRPRDIQARVRAGETPEAVAEAARTTVEKIMPFAAPVIAEREHVAQRAQRSSIRRAPGPADQPGGPRTLGDAVAARLRPLNVDPESVAWDAWRREDGRWTLTAEFESRERAGLAELTYDQPGHYVLLDNDDARWLAGEHVEGSDASLGEDGAGSVRRLSAVPDEELRLGDDALGLVSDDRLATEQPVEAYLGDLAHDSAHDSPHDAAHDTAQDTAEQPVVQSDDDQRAADQPQEAEAPTRRPVKKTRGRASVPSWDEILFGGPGEDGA